jgi:hypothetical protein
MKKKIGIVFSGQIRENSLGDTIAMVPECVPIGYLHDILESYSKHFFTDEFKNDNDYDIFISTDFINVEKTLDFFGKDNVKNIHLSNNEYYLHPIQTELKSIDYYLDRMYKMTDSAYIRFPDVINQCHRMADCYEMLRNYGSPHNYDYIIRTRLDTVYHRDINDVIKTLINNPSLIYLGNDDQFAVGRPAIMHVYFNWINNYCTYHDYFNRNNFKSSICSIETWQSFTNPANEKTYKYSSMQLWESLYRYCDDNGLDIDTSIQYVNYGIIRRHIAYMIAHQYAERQIQAPAPAPAAAPAPVCELPTLRYSVKYNSLMRSFNKKSNKTHFMPMKIIFDKR